MQTTKTFKINPAEVKNILIVRQHHQLGDMLCALPMYAAVRKKFSRSKITLVASPYNGKILQGTAEKYIDSILIYNKKSMISLAGFMNKILSSKFDLCIVPSTASISRTSHIICRLSGALYRVGVNSIEGRQNRSAGYLNIKSDFKWDIRKKHQTERNLDIVRQIGCELNTDEKSLVRLEIQDKENLFAEEFIRKNFPGGKPVAAFHPGAAKPQNRWSAEKFADLIEKISKKHGLNILLTNGPDDMPVTNKIVKELEERNIIHMAPLLPITKLAAVLKKVAVFVSNDTGPMHIAGYVGAYVIGLFGPTHSYEWGPVNKNGMFIQSENDDINSITVDEVFRAVEKYLK
ncbi:MAG: glycosyltransferase family 9 protein [Ignavibacteria bacterium]|nr:glycosyltransferase family 9 protein [Ignavibacteria bacterium]